MFFMWKSFRISIELNLFLSCNSFNLSLSSRESDLTTGPAVLKFESYLKDNIKLGLVSWVGK